MDTKVYFSGAQDHVIDDGGRIAIPSSMYSMLKNTAQPDTLYAQAAKRVISNGRVFRFVKLLRYEVLHERASRLMAEFTSDDERDQFGEVFFSKFKPLEIKVPQPRVTLPTDWLKERKSKTASKDQAFLSNNVTVAGVGEVIEIWNVDDWKERQAASESDKTSASGSQAMGA